MGAGDTIPGEVRVHGELNEGSAPRLAGPWSQDQVDYHNNTVSPEEKLYVNTWSKHRTKPAGAQSVRNTDLFFGPNEVISIRHKASSLEEAIDHDDADIAALECVFKDLNRGQTYTRTLTASDQGLSSNPTSSNSSFVEFYTFTVPSETQVLIAGAFGIIAPENA